MKSKQRFIAFIITVLIPLYSICQSTDTSAAGKDTALFNFDHSDPLEYSDSEDEIIQKIEFGQPTEPYIRFDTTYIDLFGKWCDMGTVAGNWRLQRLDFGPLTYNCNGIHFHYYGKTIDHIEGDHVVYERRKTSYVIRDSVLEFTVLTKDGTEEKECYIIVSATATEMLLKKVDCY